MCAIYGYLQAGKEFFAMYQVFDLQNLSHSGIVQLLYVTPSRFERDWNGNRHSHECFEISFCIQGKGDYLVRDAIVPVKADDFVIIPPGVEHAERSTPSAPLEYIILGITGIELTFLNSSSGYYKGTFATQQMFVLNLLSALLQELEQKQPDYSTACYNILNILLIQLNRFCQFTIKPASLPQAHNSSLSDHNIFWVKQYIDDNFTKEINLDLLAGKIGLNKFSLVRKFKKIYGTSPINYLLLRKFQEAKFLLQTTESSISQISQALGFSSASYFAQSFQKHEGISPSAYREQCR